MRLSRSHALLSGVSALSQNSSHVFSLVLFIYCLYCNRLFAFHDNYLPCNTSSVFLQDISSQTVNEELRILINSFTFLSRCFLGVSLSLPRSIRPSIYINKMSPYFRIIYIYLSLYANSCGKLLHLWISQNTRVVCTLNISHAVGRCSLTVHVARGL